MGRIIKKHPANGLKISDINTAKGAKDGVTSSNQANTSLADLRDWFNDHGVPRGGIPTAGDEVSIDDFDTSGTAYILMRAQNESDTQYDNNTFGRMEFTYGRTQSNTTAGWFLQLDRGSGATSVSTTADPYYNVILAASAVTKITMINLGGANKNEDSTQYTCRLFDCDPDWNTLKPGGDISQVWNSGTNTSTEFPFLDSHGNGANGICWGVQSGIGSSVSSNDKRCALWFKNTRIPGTHSGTALSTVTYAIFHEVTDSGNADHDYEKFSWKSGSAANSKWSNHIRMDYPAPGSYGRTTLESWSGDLGTGGE